MPSFLPLFIDRTLNSGVNDPPLISSEPCSLKLSGSKSWTSKKGHFMSNFSSELMAVINWPSG
jgi:hypothetical protein